MKEIKDQSEGNKPMRYLLGTIIVFCILQPSAVFHEQAS